jgi:alpha-glucosidase
MTMMPPAGRAPDSLADQRRHVSIERQPVADRYAWWQRGVIYHVYPRSFQDSNGDGVGDLNGITERLDYLQWLGIDAIWLSPIFRSPMVDFGYDVADYTAIDPVFGTMEDFGRLLDEAHRRGIRVLLDWVPNHTSDQHPWFIASRSSRDNPKRDWYLWRDAAPGGGPPNNWLSIFGGSAWQWDAATGQYYYHSYFKEQPDLNWRNREVRQAMLDVLRFWLDKGVDGFRIDALSELFEDELLRDNPSNSDFHPGEDQYLSLRVVYSADQPEMHQVVRELRALVDSYGDRVLIGELYLPIDQTVRYYETEGTGIHLPTNFHLLLSRWSAMPIAALIDAYEAAIPDFGWPNWALSNLDRPRVATRIGRAQARVAAMLLLTLRGTPTIYYGDEIGMHDVAISSDAILDPAERTMPGLAFGRDRERTPMQWDATPHAGFTYSPPWLPLAEDSRALNVETERADPRSVLSLYRQLIGLRRRKPALNVGRYRRLAASGGVLAYERSAAGQRFAVILNLAGSPTSYEPADVSLIGVVELSTHLDRVGEPVRSVLSLRADEGLVVELGGTDDETS